jgi:hypothetical protein
MCSYSLTTKKGQTILSLVVEQHDRGDKGMIRLSTQKMQNAISRSKQIKPTVRMIGERVYSVTSSNRSQTYTVTFKVINGMRLGECNCAAGIQGFICFHLASAAALNIGIQSMRNS